MKAVIQRVRRAAVRVEGDTVAAMGHGLVVLLGVETGDTARDAEFVAEKIAGLRLFDDDTGRMNRSVQEVGGAVLVVSQFTLLADVRKGRRPGFDRAAPPEEARRLYQYVVHLLQGKGLPVQTGRFGARMDVEIHNAGPVTILLDSRRERPPSHGGTEKA